MLNFTTQHKLGAPQRFIVTNNFLCFTQFGNEYIVHRGEFQMLFCSRLTRNVKYVTISTIFTST